MQGMHKRKWEFKQNLSMCCLYFQVQSFQVLEFFAMKSFPYPLPSPLAHLDPTMKIIRTWTFEVKGASVLRKWAFLL